MGGTGSLSASLVLDVPIHISSLFLLCPFGLLLCTFGLSAFILLVVLAFALLFACNLFLLFLLLPFSFFRSALFLILVLLSLFLSLLFLLVLLLLALLLARVLLFFLFFFLLFFLELLTIFLGEFLVVSTHLHAILGVLRISVAVLS